MAAERLRPGGGGGGGSSINFWPHSSHATPIGSMLKSRIQMGLDTPVPPPPPRSAAYVNRSQKYVPVSDQTPDKRTGQRVRV